MIPITVTVAIVIFVARELLEAYRRRTTNKLKLSAIKNQLASECERTNWAIHLLRRAITDVRTAGTSVQIQATPLGVRRLVFPNPDDDPSSPVPKAYSGTLDKHLFEVASLDADLFQKMIGALAGVAELNHVLESLIEYIEEENQPWLDGWTHYASRGVGKSEEPILYLYEACTGQALTKTRLR